MVEMIEMAIQSMHFLLCFIKLSQIDLESYFQVHIFNLRDFNPYLITIQ